MAYDLGRSEGLIRIVYDSEGVAHAQADFASLEESVKTLENAAARINIDVLDDDARRELVSIQGEIDALRERIEVGVDVDDRLAREEIASLAVSLHALDAQSTSLDFEVDTRAVEEAIGRVQMEMSSIADETIEINVDDADVQKALTLLQKKLDDLHRLRTELAINVDDKEARASLEEIQRELLDLDKESTNIVVDLDKRRAQAQLDLLDKELKKLDKEVVNIKLDPDTAKAREDLQEVAIQLELLKRARADAKVGVDGVPAAMAQIAALRTELDRLDGKEFDPKVNKKGMSQYAEFRENLFSVLQLAAAFAPAMIPVIAALTAVGAAGAAAFGGLAAGFGLFAGAAVADLKGVNGALKLVQQSQDAYNKALATGDQKAQLKAINESIGAMKQLSPAEQMVAMGWLKLKEAWSNMAASIKPQVLEAAYRGMAALGSIVDKLAPLLGNVADVVVDLARKFQEFAASKEVQQFLDDVAGSITQLGEDAGDTFLNFLTAALNLFHLLLPYGVEFANWMARFSERVKDASGSSKFAEGVQKFFAYAKEIGPSVKEFLGALWNALVNLGKAATPLGPPMLNLLTNLLNIIAAVAGSPLGPFILSLIAMGLAAKTLLGPISGVIDNIKTVNTTLSALSGSKKALEALPENMQGVVKVARAMAGGVKDAASKMADLASAAGSKTVDGLKAVGRAAADGAGKLKDLAVATGGKLLSGLQTLGSVMKAGVTAAIAGLRVVVLETIPAIWAFMAPWLPWIALAAAIGAAIYLLYRNWDTVWNAIKTVFFAVVNFVADHWKWLLALFPVIGPVLALIANNWSTIWNAIKVVALAVWGAIRAVVSAGIAFVQAVVSGTLGAISATWNAVWGAIQAAAAFVWALITGIVSAEINAIRAIITAVLGAIQGTWNAIWSAVSAVASFIWNSIVGFIQGAINMILGAVRGVTAVVGIITGAFQSAYNGVSNVVGSIVGFVAGIPGKILGALGDLGGMLYDAGSAIISGLWNGLKDKAEQMLGWVGSLAGKIKSLKGPLEKDKVLLIDEGQAIIQGLQKGMASALPGLLQMVSDIAPTIQLNTASSIPDAVLSGATGGSAAPINQNFTFSFGDISGGPGAADTIRAAVTSPDVLGQIMSAARAGVRG